MNHDTTTEQDWSERRANTPEEATAKMRWWVTTHGLRAAIINVTTRERALVPAAERRAINATAATNHDEVHLTVFPVHVLDTWCDLNSYQIISTRQLAEAVNCSQATARRFIKNNPHRFKRLNQYTYEVRDWQSDRKHAKSI